MVMMMMMMTLAHSDDGTGLLCAVTSDTGSFESLSYVD
jgi:hypothetical protein